MKICSVTAVYYSATGNTGLVTKTVAGRLAEALGLPLHTVDFTLPAARQESHVFGPQDLVVFGMPVYAGRVPNKLLGYLQSGFTGTGALAVPVVTFGNRNFDNGLMELRNELTAHDFFPVAGAAQPAQHVFSEKLATGRPNQTDLDRLGAFARSVAEKLQAPDFAPAGPVAVAGDDPVGPYYTPLGTDGKPAVFLKAKPRTDPDKCDRCGICAAACPMGSIPAEDPTTVTGICIKCQACVKKCPTGAKYFDDPAFLSHVAMLEANYTRPSEARFFL